MSLQFSMGEYLKRYNKSLPKKYEFKGTTEAEWMEWKNAFKDKLHELMGEWPSEKVSLQPLLLERTEKQHYWLEKWIIQSELDMQIPFYMLIPKELGDVPKPAVLCLHGHGYGKDGMLGINHGEWHQEAVYNRTNYAIAPKLAEAGYVVLVPDARGFGERFLGYGYKFRFNENKDGCDLVFLKALLLGINPLTLNVWDAMRCVDYLQTRNEVDGDRIGCVGLSFGGTWTLYTTIFEDRIKAAAVCGFLNSYEEYAINQGNICGSQMIPNLLRYGEMGDVAGLVAPKPVLFSNGIQDDGFPIKDAVSAYETVHRVYQAAGCLEKTKLDQFDGGHEIHQEAVLDWLQKWL